MRSFFHGSQIQKTLHYFELEDTVTFQPMLSLFSVLFHPGIKQAVLLGSSSLKFKADLFLHQSIF